MNILHSQLIFFPIISLQTGQTIGKLGNAIVNLEKLEIVAFFVTENPIGPEATLMIRDIRQLAKDCLVIDSADEIANSSEIVRIQQLLNSGYKVVGLPVFTQSGTRLGNVIDFTINWETKLISKLYVKPKLWQRFLSSNLVIDRLQIVEVTNSRVTTSDATSKQTILGPQPVKPRA